MKSFIIQICDVFGWRAKLLRLRVSGYGCIIFCIFGCVLTGVLPMLGCAEMPVKTEDSRQVAADSKSAASMPAKAPFVSAAGVLLAYEMIGDLQTVPAGGCRLKLENLKARKEVFVSLKKDTTVIYKELEPGRYFGTRLSCSTTGIWNLENLFGLGFDVEAGKVSYLGKVVFDFAKGELSSFKQGTRQESQNALSAAIESLPSGDAGALVSAYSRRPIVASSIGSEGAEGFDVYAKGLNNPDTTLSDLMSRLKRCAVDDAKDDPIRLGHIQYVATYRAGVFADMKEAASETAPTHALRRSFLICVDNSLRTFKPPAKNDVEVRVRF